MQLIVIDAKDSHRDQQLLQSMQRLRARIFAGRLNWQVESRNGLEHDRFDDDGPTYILCVEEESCVVGCVRLLPPMRSSMLNEVFPDLLDGQALELHERMIESSRFCIDRQGSHEKTRRTGQAGDGCGEAMRPPGQCASIVHVRTRMLLAGIVEWCLSCGYTELVTATDIRFERLLKMVGWPLRRLGSPRMINETHSVAGSLVISQEVLTSLKPEGYPSLRIQTARAG